MCSGLPASKRDFHRNWNSPLSEYIPIPLWVCRCDAKVFQAAKELSSSREMLFHLFAQIRNFLSRLEIYTEVSPTPAMKRIIIEIMAEILSILAIATKEINRPTASESIPGSYVVLTHVR